MNKITIADKLTQDQLDFLSHHRIDLSEVLDATGMRTTDYRTLMRDENYKVAIGVTLCKLGHAMRTSGVHCAQCYPGNLGHKNNHRQSNFIYLFASRHAGLVKIGICKDVKQRLAEMNRKSIANANDWRQLLAKDVGTEAGPVETEAHRRLKPYRTDNVFTHGLNMQQSREHFSCTPEEALKVLKELT